MRSIFPGLMSLAILSVALPLYGESTSVGTTLSRSVAITIDDLPVVRGKDIASQRRVTESLVSILKESGIPAIGFVNEKKLGEPDPLPEQIALLETWIDAGLELGNHTYSHPSFFETPLEQFKEEVTRGELVTKKLLAGNGARPRYFRHPFLNTGPDIETRKAFEDFLKTQGYAVAPVTIDNEEWVYAHAYDIALEAGDVQQAARIGRDYVDYMSSIFGFYEDLSMDLLGREPAQILLIHANQLNADYLRALLVMIRARGYRFISLDKALADPAYAQLDEYAGKGGISWLHRWWITKGQPVRKDPSASAWVRRYIDQLQN